MTYSIHHPIWNCPKKIEAREQTIILPYQEFYGRKSIPKNKQYWTMSGSYENKHGDPIEGEFHQLKKSGLITDNQFHAVDINEGTISKNEKHYPNLNWYCSDFLTAMEECSIDGNFSPEIVNCDNVRMMEKGTRYLVNVLMFLRDNSDKVMVISNLMLNSSYRKTVINTGQDMIDEILSIYDLDVWNVFPYCYKYHGSGAKARTWMGSLVLIKNTCK